MPQRAPGSKGGRGSTGRLDFAAPRRQFPRAAPPPVRFAARIGCAPISALKRRSPISRPVSMKCAPWPRKAIRPRSPRKSASSRPGPRRRWPISTPISRPGRRRWWRAPRGGRGSATTSRGSSPSSRRSPATAISARTKRSSAASEDSRASRSASSGRRRATTRRAGCGTISAWRGRKAIARRRGSWSLPTASACR